MRALEILMPLSQQLPVGDHIDPDGLVTYLTDALGVPKKVLKPQSVVDEEREQKAMMQQEQMERQMEQEDVATVGQAAQAVRMVGANE